jgi:SnoaL-like polyketide cyclase
MDEIGGQWLDGYIDAWLGHVVAGGPGGAAALALLIGFMADDVVYDDVPSAARFVGHQGVADMARIAFELSADLTLEIASRQTDGRSFAFETRSSGTNTGRLGPMAATGRSFTLRGVSIGTVTRDGLVDTHRDYWDMAALLGQLGLTG